MDHENYSLKDPNEHPRGWKVHDRVKFVNGEGVSGRGVIVSFDGDTVHIRLDNDMLRWGLIVVAAGSIYSVDVGKVESA